MIFVVFAVEYYQSGIVDDFALHDDASLVDELVS